MNKDSALQILGLGQNASRDEIKARVRELSVKFHPDKHVGVTDVVGDLLKEKFSQVQEAGRLLLDGQSERADPPVEDADPDLVAAAIAFRDGDASTCVRHARAVLARSPNNYDAHFLCGSALLGVDNLVEAAVHLRRVIEVEKEDSHVWFLLAVAELGNGNFAASKNCAEKACRFSEVKQADHYVILAQAWIGLGDGAQADSVINDLAAIAPNHPLVLERKASFRVGSTYINKGTAAGVATGAAGALCCLLDCC